MNPDLPAAKPTCEAMPKSLWIILGIIATVAAVGINLIEWMKEGPLCFPDPGNWFNAFFVTIGKTEPYGLYLVLIFCILSIALLGLNKQIVWLKKREPWLLKNGISVIAFAVFLLAGAGTWFVFHHYPLAADENMPNFQAEIFLSGHWQAKPPQDLLPILRLIRPLLTAWDIKTQSWCSGYLPVYAALRTPFYALNLDGWLNPLLGAVSIVAFAGIIRILWPQKPFYAVIGAAFLATSPQFLLYCMTAYSMSAHLTLNFIWLWLYLQPGKRIFALTPFVGVAALGLHNPLVHALFAAPFLLRLVIDRKWKSSIWFIFIYGIGIACWWNIWKIIQPTFSSGSFSPFSLESPFVFITHAVNILALLGWMALPLPVLAILGLIKLKQLPPIFTDCVLSCLLTFCFYITVRYDQGFGWGYRYFHGTYGCLLLLCMAGWESLEKHLGEAKSRRFSIVGLLLSVVVLIPLRCLQAEEIVRPFARAEESFLEMDADAVVYDPRTAWYSSELGRNDPFLRRRPLIISLLGMNEQQMKFIESQFTKVYIVSKEEMASYGLATTRWKASDNN